MSNSQLVRTYAAHTDLSAKKGYAVYLTTATKTKNTPEVAICTANARGIGIIVEPPLAADKGVGVCVGGFCKAILGETVTAGVPLRADTNGALVTASTDKDKVIAISQEGGDAADLIEVEILRYDLAV